MTALVKLISPVQHCAILQGMLHSGAHSFLQARDIPMDGFYISKLLNPESFISPNTIAVAGHAS